MDFHPDTKVAIRERLAPFIKADRVAFVLLSIMPGFFLAAFASDRFGIDFFWLLPVALVGVPFGIWAGAAFHARAIRKLRRFLLRTDENGFSVRAVHKRRLVTMAFEYESVEGIRFGRRRFLSKFHPLAGLADQSAMVVCSRSGEEVAFDQILDVFPVDTIKTFCDAVAVGLHNGSDGQQKAPNQALQTTLIPVLNSSESHSQFGRLRRGV